MTRLRVRIVGGSLGGLFTAALLHRDGHDGTLYERSVGGLAGRLAATDWRRMADRPDSNVHKS